MSRHLAESGNQPATALMISAVDSGRGGGRSTGWIGPNQGGLEGRQPETDAPTRTQSCNWCRAYVTASSDHDGPPSAGSPTQASWQCCRSAQIAQLLEVPFPRRSFRGAPLVEILTPCRALSTAVGVSAPALRAAPVGRAPLQGSDHIQASGTRWPHHPHPPSRAKNCSHAKLVFTSRCTR